MNVYIVALIAFLFGYVAGNIIGYDDGARDNRPLEPTDTPDDGSW